jgi:hypothetical protein
MLQTLETSLTLTHKTNYRKDGRNHEIIKLEQGFSPYVALITQNPPQSFLFLFLLLGQVGSVCILSYLLPKLLAIRV